MVMNFELECDKIDEDSLVIAINSKRKTASLKIIEADLSCGIYLNKETLNELIEVLTELKEKGVLE